MFKSIDAAILGSGNIGTDLLLKLLKKRGVLNPKMLVGIDPNSKGLMLARENGIIGTPDGIDAILADDGVKIVFDATSATAHAKNAPRLKAAGKIAIDMTPAAVGPYVVPVVNLDKILDQQVEGLNVNMITCGGQATIPIMKAISRVVDVNYGEIVATIASKSAGPGTRANIDEFTETTARGLVEVGGARKGKAIILLNPAEPPIMMNNVVYASCSSYPKQDITDSVNEMVSKIQAYVPGYRLKAPPQFYDDKVVVMIEVEGAGDFLPKYAGNLDVMTSAAKTVGELIAERLLKL